MITYGSVCSGVEAASLAWHPLGWLAAWLSEIEPFPARVLAHRYPGVPNLGDMLQLTNNATFQNEHIDLLVGGTPCQSFSVAGLRLGLDDDRGNLALEFVRLLMCKRPGWFVWENVPGVLSSTGGADFAAILSGFTGRDIEPQRFTTSGIIEGGFYSVAWRVLDAQHFGVPQRRRRLFVVGHIGNDWRPPFSVLFERGWERIPAAEQVDAPTSISALTSTDYKGPSKQRPNLVIPTAQGDRKFTPLEHERLQGFPDGYTDIPGASDTARYKAIGNSMAVPVMSWIGKRIDTYERIKLLL